MKNNCTFIFLIIVLFSTEIRAQQDEGYVLVWQDEFDRDGRPDKTHWTYEKGFVRNREAQWYQEDNAFCLDGFLIIEARHEARLNPNFESREHSDWKVNRDSIRITSSSLMTKGKHDWKFGRFEIRAKIPTDAGMWPAFWTLGANGRWPETGEIDIMEYYLGKMLANAAWASETDGKAAWDAVALDLASFNDKSFADKFHVWRMDWNPEHIKLYLDDQLLNTIDLSLTTNRSGEAINPFHQPHYLLVNLAVGGTQGGDYGKTSFPKKFIVDYVRVYQLPR